MNSPSKQFIPEITADGSPTLRLIEKSSSPDVDISTQNRPESMHHSAGAATETEYIYGVALRHALEMNPFFKTTIVGLGLGYIEILATAIQKKTDLLSFETDLDLIQSFENWRINGEKSSIHDLVVSSLKLDLSQTLILLKKNALIIEPMGLNRESYLKYRKSNLICYDAFSSQTTDYLWTEDFLEVFIEKHLEFDALFVTYACTGHLKRALKKYGFSLIERKGFTGKRDSTFAVRGKMNQATSYLKIDSHNQ